jgi:hypothetical protein
MDISFHGTISPSKILDGVDVTTDLNGFKVCIKNSDISLEYSGTCEREEIETKAKELVKDIVTDLSFKYNQKLDFEDFNRINQVLSPTEIGLVQTFRIHGCKIRRISKSDVDDILNEISTKKTDEILSEAKSHYIKSLNGELDIESRGSHLYKSFEEIKKVPVSLNVSPNLIKETSKILQKARHIEKKDRIPGMFTNSDYSICKDVIKELIERYSFHLNGGNVSNYRQLNKSDFFK